MDGQLPAQCRGAADEVLVTAAKAGADLRDLGGLAAVGDLRPFLPEQALQDEDQVFEDRSVRLETTFDGAGVLYGDLTPECAAVVGAVLDALSAPRARRTPARTRAAVPRRAAGGDATAGNLHRDSDHIEPRLRHQPNLTLKSI